MKIDLGTIIAERYEIIEKIGAGGMSIVYKARDTKLDRYVTFKVMREEYIADNDFIARFSIEARAAASLSHPNIVNVYDVGNEGAIYYIVMEYINGVTLKELINKRAPFDNDETLGVAIQIANALSMAHHNGVIHRDIKPQNILVTTKGSVKVTDFGIARAASATTMTVTAGSSTMGSVHYFSPEQARGGYVDSKSDIYSLGILLFEMATGKIPFDGDTAVSVALKHINNPLPDMKELNPAISDSLSKIIIKATEKVSSKRYQTIDEMCNDLKRALTNTSGDFIYRELLDESPTVKLTEDDIQAIKRDSAGKDQNKEYKRDPVRVIPEDKPRKRNDDFDDDDEEEDDDDDTDTGSERKVAILAVLTALTVIALILAVGTLIYNKTRPTPIVVPDLLGKTIPEAQAIMNDIGLKLVKDGEQFSDEYDEGVIISQNLSKTAQVFKGETIKVIISIGTTKVEVPDFINMEYKEVYDIISGTQFGLRDEYGYDSKPQNVVYKQTPEAGEMAEPNTVITIYISLGQEAKKVNVPSLVGKREGEAIETLQGLGLVVGHSTKAESSSVKEGYVLKQSIEAGTEVLAGTTVSLTISSGVTEVTATPKPSPTPSPNSKSKSFVVDPAYIPEGAEKVHLRILKVTQNKIDEFFDGIVDVSKFPMTFEVTGEGIADYQVYVGAEQENARYQGTETVDFSE